MLGEMRSEQQLPVRECFLLGSVSSELGRHGAAQLEVDRAGRLSYLASIWPHLRCRVPAPATEVKD